MPWSIDGPSSEQLGYVRRRKPTGMADSPQEQAQTKRRWITIAVVLTVAALVGLYGAAVWRQTDRSAVAAGSVGTWIQSGSVGSVLTITRLPLEDHPTVTGDLFFEGSVDRREVYGAVVAPGFPSMSTILHLTLLGQRWELRLPRQNEMTLTNSSGRVITLWKVS
jgi:hypothetical protein